MKKITVIVLIALSINGCNEAQEQASFRITGTILETHQSNEVLLLTQTNEVQDTAKISSDKFEFTGSISEPTNAAIMVDGIFFPFPITNDEIEIEIYSINNNEYEVQFQSSQVNINLQEYYRQESKEYLDYYKLLEERKVKSKNDAVKYQLMISQDSLAINFIEHLINKYKDKSDISGLSIILSDLKGLIGTRNQPDAISDLFELLPVNEQNGFYGNKIKTYLDQSARITPGQEVNFDFADIMQNTYALSDFKGKLVLLEFWATWCGPCISKMPLLKQVSEKNSKIQLISISIDEDLQKWNMKVKELGLNWINLHYKQNTIDLKQHFYISGVPYNILISQEGKILRKNIPVNELMELLN